MALGANPITTVAKAKAWLKTDDLAGVDAIGVYHDGTTDTTADVEVTGDSLILNTSGGVDDTIDLTNASFDTLTEVVDQINSNGGWVAQLLYHADALSADLVPLAATDCFEQGALHRLKIAETRGIELLIDAVTKEIEDYLGRGIASRTYTEERFIQRGGGRIDQLVLREPDVTSCERVSLNTFHAATITYSGAATRATVEVTDTAIITRSRSSGVETETTTTFASNVTLAALKTTIDAISGWTLTIPSSVDTTEDSTYLVRMAARKAKSLNVQLTAWTDHDADFTLLPDEGILDLRFWTWPAEVRDPLVVPGVRKILVVYTAGFATVPADVEQVALEMIESERQKSGRDDNLQSESLGPYSYTLSTSVTDHSDWMRRLERYKRRLP